MIRRFLLICCCCCCCLLYRSIVVQLFQGQLKSVVRCKHCKHTSVKFDPFTFLTLPLPADSDTNIDILLIRLGGEIPERYSLKIDIESKYSEIKLRLEQESGVKKEEILFTDVYGGTVRGVVLENQKIKTVLTGNIYSHLMSPDFDWSTIVQSGGFWIYKIL